MPLPEHSPEIVREQIDGVIAQGLEDDSLAVLAIADALSDVILDSVVLLDLREDSAEVGFWLAPEARVVARLRMSGEVATVLTFERSVIEFRSNVSE